MPDSSPAVGTPLVDLLFDRRDVGLCLVGPDGRIRRANPEWLRSTGYTATEAIGAELAVLHPGAGALTRELLERARGGERATVRPHVHRLHGRETWWEGSLDPVRLEDGVGVLVTTHEVTRAVGEGGPSDAAVRDAEERIREYERALREREALYRSLFTLAPSGVVLNDDRGRLIAFNDQAHLQLGYTREEFARLGIADIDADEGPEGVRGHIARIDATGGEEYEVHHRTKSGEVRDVLVRTRPVEIGGERGFLSVWQDITDRKRAEAALRESDQRKSEFLALLSHELRNPLAPIRNGLALLDRVPPDGDQARRARAILHRQTLHLSRLVDDLLDVTRISRGKIELHRARVEAGELARRTCDDHRSLFEQQGVTLRFEGCAEAAWLDADATRLAQVLGNLLQNAAKFTPPGGAAVVAVRATPDRVELRVRDDGAGMEAADVERMFEPFAQGDHSLARTRGGLGLGLALVRGLVELHGGSVHAHSDGPGRGSEFVVSLWRTEPPGFEAVPGGRR